MVNFNVGILKMASATMANLSIPTPRFTANANHTFISFERSSNAVFKSKINNFGIEIKSKTLNQKRLISRFSLAENDKPIEDVIPPGCSRVKVSLGKPLGMVLEERNGNIFVSEIVPTGNADNCGLISVGDQLIATSAIIFNSSESYGSVRVPKGMEVIRFNVRGERFETVMAAIGSHPGTMKVTVEFQKCEPETNESETNPSN